MKTRFSLWLLVYGLALLALIVMARQLIGPAEAMGWYEVACCNQKDCEQIPDTAVTITAKGYHVQYVGQLGFHVDVIVPFNKARPSRNEHFHGCASSDRFLCLYVPGTT